ncbi:hypothetical protein [Heyndrickxia sporothermodurans]|uniref:hypothetical protein n=1 Tax=Heyndrickxia sporothermodurans TaxID=46224 RepID=UPI000D3715E8|nr:hypothetical protein [Heyndrickxia sporothermodurans]PTY92322.1 hypothetical protein B5V90_03440 [Heyndrickxia sporothermodurans]
MAKKLHEIPTMEDFLKGLEKIKSQQLEARESSKLGVYPFEGTDNQFSHYATGVVTPKGKHYLIDGEGGLSFTGTKYLTYEGKEAFPPFSAAELLLESKNDFKIDYAEAVKYYNLNKELAMKENENILSSKEFKPDHPIALTVNQEMKEVKNMLEEQGLDPSKNPEVSALLDQHFSKLEKILTDFSEKIEKASHEDIPQLEENVKGKLNKIFIDLKDGLKQLFVDMKDKVRSGIENKVNDVKINIHNAVAEKVQNVNDKIKNLTESLDKKYQVIEKEPEKLQKGSVGQLNKEDDLQVTQPLSQVQKASNEVKLDEKTEGANLKAPEESQSLAVIVPKIGDLEKQNKQLKKENDGLKTFVNVVKSKHPDVYQSIYNTMKGVQQGEPKQEQSEIKTKVKEEIEL